jgi:exopolyphosphatase/pppGpp-phosphohydrolase
MSGCGDPAGAVAGLADRPAVVADRGLREGLLYAQMSADGVLEERV